MSYAWSVGSVPFPSSEFQSLLEKGSVSSAGEFDLIEEDYDEAPRRKGNPQMLSKKEKALLKVRRKL
jgi:hypothetical protein